MQVRPFVEETLTLLETATNEVVVEAAQSFRNAAGPNEHGVVEQFNQFIIDNPLPLPTP